MKELIKRQRGRPRKNTQNSADAEPRRGCGRPTLPLSEDPDRYAIALFYALSRMGHSERRAALNAAVGITPAKIVEPSRPGVMTFEKTGVGASSYQAIATRIRNKAKAVGRKGVLQEKDGVWIGNMAMAMVCSFGAKNPAAKNFAMMYAESVGERDYAINQLLPAIDAILAGHPVVILPPNFSPDILAKPTAKK